MHQGHPTVPLVITSRNYLPGTAAGLQTFHPLSAATMLRVGGGSKAEQLEGRNS